MNRKVLIIGFLLVLLGGLGYWWYSNNNSNNIKEKVNIGAVIPLTGDYGAYGNYMKQGMELALNDAIMNGNIKKGEVKLIFEDSKANPQIAVNSFNKLISIDKVVATIPATSGVTLAMKPIANNKKVILVNATAIGNEIEDASDYMYSIIPNADFEGKYLAEYAFKKLNKRNIAIVYRNDPSGKSFNESISKKFIELGGKVVYQDSHQPNEENFTILIDKIKNYRNIDAVFVMSFGPEVANFAKNAKEKNLNKQIITYETFHSPKSIEIAKDAANGIIFCSPKFNVDSNMPEIKVLKENIYKKYGGQKEFNYFIAAHYDAMSLLLKAVSEGNRRGEEIKKYFDSMKYFDGITGRIKFSSFGSASVAMSIYTVKNGKFEIIF